MKHTVVVIPTFRERENIGRLIPAVLHQDPGISVLVVDDNSPDGTADIVRELAAADSRVALLSRAQAQGIGPAYKAGFIEALRNGADYIVQMDADFSHPAEMLPEFIREMRDYDIVLGSRYLNGITVVNWPIERLLLSYFGNWYSRRITGLPNHDVTGGFKCWRREVLDRIGLERVRSNGYAFQIEMTYRAWRLGYRIKEIPIIFMDRTDGDSKMNKRIALEALWIVWWLRLMHLAGRL
ncbi:MAG: polyprenol monophosphomannose synthase [Deltaproteobacteria bacterium]|nr:polyprenol monophosphomannose synthase [Deltaproteobacteria bacterium]